MQRSETVPSKRAPLSKADLHSKLMLGWTRVIATCGGQGGFLDKMDITRPALTGHMTGSFPSFELIDRAYDINPSVLDDWLREKGARIVDSDAVCDTDDVSVLVSRLLNKLIEAQHPDSPGGRRIVGPEILAMDDLLREVVRVASSLIDQGTVYRGDNVTDLRRTA